ncbi:MAG: acyltransferase family protein [Solirubrobacterales bacterium]|nr:acyltransferase family protein [Solirubrobacterales bacterium]MBV9534165.1 acyltransferase family protein [Solirubrobacterales bacterium]
MPRPIDARGQRYVPGLDGLRAIAVLCVIAYHVNMPWAQGGMLGVGVFFTLSGYLITDLLLEHYARRGDLGLGQFWLRRARRLLPALFLMLVAVSVWVALFDASQLDGVRRQVISAALYFANWSNIAAHASYFARFSQPLPLDHMWSLSIEEQFYLLWPWLVFLAIWIWRSRAGVAIFAIAGTAASVWVMGHVFHPGNLDPTRVYEGTDSRAFELLIGCALAVVRPTHFPRFGSRVPVRRVLALDVLGVAGLVTIFVLVWKTTPFTSFLYPDGFLLLSFATAAVIAAVVHSASALGALLGARPLQWIGVRSYGIYLWQWPIVVLWGAASTHVQLGKAVLQLAVTLVVASLSWRFVEDPIRRGALGRLWRQGRMGAARLRERRTGFALAGTVLAGLAVAAVGLGGLLPEVASGRRRAPEIAHLPPRLANVSAVADPTARRQSTTPAAVPFIRSFQRQTSAPTHTSCRSVVYIGDSTSEGQISSAYIPDPHKQLQAQLAKVGVRTTIPEISGARSIVEVFEGHPNGATVAREHVGEGYRGCWVLALGTNDTADVAAGSNAGQAARIARMMRIIGNQPVLWIDTITLLSSGPYAESGMQRWNNDLLAACRRYPTMRIFDWAAHARRKWFIPDGIHYYSPGYIARNRYIARGLAEAFPQGGSPSPTCLVS